MADASNPFSVYCKPGWHPVIAFGVPVACLPDSIGAATSSGTTGGANPPDQSGAGSQTCSPGWNPVQVFGQTVMCVPSQEMWASIGIHTLIVVLGALFVIIGLIAVLGLKE